MSQRISWGFSKKPVTPSATVTVLSPDLLNLLSMDISSSSRLIDDLTHEEGEHDDGYVGTLKEITKQHWKSAESSKACQNKECRKVFSTVLERPHHCRRCGEVFCADCLKYKRRLNKLAHFDPDGDLYKVCKSCFELDKTTEGQVRNHSKDFAALRTAHKFVSTTEANGAVPSARRSQLDYDVEYERLTKGFAGSIGSSEIKKTLHELRSVLSTPDWMKSSVWIQENLASFCQFCKGDFGLMKKKAFCRVCGKCVCKSCSTKDLLVYVPDGEREKGVKCSPKLAIIKYVGCPEVEPEISLYLRVCKHCKDRLVDKQVRLEEEEDQLSNGPDFLEALIRVHQKLVKAELGVKDQLPKYRDVVDSLEDGTRRTNLQSNTKILAKAQGDLADVLAQHVTIVQQLKKLKPQTETQASLLKTYIRAKCDFYLEHQAQFRALKHKLCESVPAESLDFIQRIMDKNAIISTHLYLRQLVYETLHLTDRHKIEDDLPLFLMAVEQKVEEDVKACLKNCKEDVEEHMMIVKDMIRMRMKENKLIRPSPRQVKQRGSRHVHELMNSRTEAVLNQVNFQLQLASAIRSFQGSKDSLDGALKELSVRRETEKSEGQEFVIVDKIV
ncbi:vacuolar segregation protein PEP7 isoform X1 [Aplysia californica]|uniref:Vacuolar segregation protein PEP7 isoform X1 n=1 Tax=Aplysia californica TaxID=6500 RepID=A0ABM0K0X3_APLCA|nr:vacuolar segregation protein PEP7 isoform X1 [Aplysia californica]